MAVALLLSGLLGMSAGDGQEMVARLCRMALGA